MIQKITFSIFFIVCAISSYAQKSGDTTSILTDTINIHGKIIDEEQNPVEGAELLALAFSMHSRFSNGYRKTFSNKDGFFMLNGIKPTDTIFVYTNFGKQIVVNNGSRSLTIMVKKHKTIAYNSPLLKITSKRKIEAPKIKLDLVYSGNWHEPEGLYVEPEYPGRVEKFWDFIKTNIKYPDIAKILKEL